MLCRCVVYLGLVSTVTIPFMCLESHFLPPLDHVLGFKAHGEQHRFITWP